MATDTRPSASSPSFLPTEPDVGGGFRTMEQVGSSPVNATLPLDASVGKGLRAAGEGEILPRASVGRLDSLTGLRWFAAFVVFLHHVQQLAPIKPLIPVLKHGIYGVTFFFVLSGFVLTWSSVQSTGAPTFYWRRFSRIYPSHFVALLLAIPIFYSFNPDPSQSWVKPVSIGILLLSVPLIQAWWTDPTVTLSGNPAAWTLTCEFFFYAVHPWVMKPFRRLLARGALVLAAGVFLLEVAYREAVARMPHSWLAHVPVPITELPAFIIGMLLAVAMRRGWKTRIHPIFAYVTTGVVVWYLASLITHPSTNRFAVKAHVMTPELMLLCCAFMIVCVASRDVTDKPSILRRRFWVRLGEWSFCFYLVHATVVYLARELVGLQLHGWQNLWWWALMLVLGLIASAALHYIVEKPMESGLRGWWDKRLAVYQAKSRLQAEGAGA